MRVLMLLVAFAAISQAQDEPIGATKKRIDDAAELIKSKDSKSKLEGLRLAAELKGDAVSLLPLIFREMLGSGKKSDEKVIFQAIIASEAIDAEIHGHVMAVRPGTSWADRADVLERMTRMPDAKIKRLDYVVNWMIPQFGSLKPTPNLRTKMITEGKKIRPDNPGGDEKSIRMLLHLMWKFDGKFIAERETLAWASIKVGNAWTRFDAYVVLWHMANREDRPKEKKPEYLSAFFKGLNDPEPDIQLGSIVAVGQMRSDAKEAADRFRKIAATHDSKAFRDAAADALRKIEGESGKEKPKKIVPMTIDPPKKK